MVKILKKDFFERSALTVARELIGKYLVRLNEGKIERFKIVETESYGGYKDKASHSSKGRTKRNEVMFGEAGRIYVYFTYGMHYMLNIVCGRSGYPAAVLIRGVEGIIGPGRLTKKLEIDKNLNGEILGKKTGLWIESPSLGAMADQRKIKIKRSSRIGVDSSGPIWSKKLYRFFI
jgi:DNA-3-methyladenine glycosylase